MNNARDSALEPGLNATAIPDDGFAATGEESRMLRAALNLTADAVVILAAPDMQVIDVNRAACEMLGYPREEVVGRRLAALSDHRWKSILPPPAGARSRGRPSPRTASLRLRRRDRSELEVECSFSHFQGGARGYWIGVFRPSQDGLAARSGAHAGFYDALTGLPNRRLLASRFERAVRPQRAQEDACALLFVDLDGFKTINDTWGHLCGDDVLRTVAQRLASSVRPGDLVARFGGDEFVVLVEHVRSRREALKIARRIQKSMEAPIDAPHGPLAISASIGAVLCSDRTASLDRFIDAADRAMYRAKSLGRSGRSPGCVLHRVGAR